MNTTKDLENFNLYLFRERMMEDTELMTEVAEAMLEDTPSQIKALRVSLDNGDCDGIGKIGHKVKGSAANLCCHRLETVAWQIEMAGKQGKIAELPDLVTELEAAWQNSLELLQRFLQKAAE